MMYVGSRIVCFNNLRSSSGNAAFLSMKTKTANDAIDAINELAICITFSEFMPVSIKVRAIRNDDIVEESARAPLRSMFNLLFTSPVPLIVSS